MRYFDEAAKRLFPSAERIEEDWDERSVDFFFNLFENSTLTVSSVLLGQIKEVFGTNDLHMEYHHEGKRFELLDRRGPNGPIAYRGPVLQITLKNVHFPERPK